MVPRYPVVVIAHGQPQIHVLERHESGTSLSTEVCTSIQRERQSSINPSSVRPGVVHQ